MLHVKKITIKPKQILVLTTSWLNKVINGHVRASTKCVSRNSTSDPCNTCAGGEGGGGRSGGKHSISYKPYVQPFYQDHDHKNMGLKRPMSPHLEIYAPTLPAMSSISQRISGTILSFYSLLLAGGALFLSNGIDTYITIIQSLNLSTPLIVIGKCVLGLPFWYHYFIGIRFCLWNAGKILRMGEIYKSAYISFIATAVMAVLCAIP